MNYLTRLALIGAFAFAFGANFIHAQPAPLKKDEPVKAIGKLQIDQKDFKHHTRAAIPFKKIEMTDPKTGKVVKATDSITLADGKVVVAGPYYIELNRLQEKFNKLGHSLTENTGANVVLHDAVIPRDDLKKQGDTHTRAHLAFNAKTMRAPLAHADLDKAHATALTTDTKRIQSLGVVKAAQPGVVAPKSTKTVDVVKTWKTQLGKQSLVAAFLEGKLEFHGNSDHVKVQADASAGGYLVNHRMVLLQAKGSIDSPAKGNSRALLNVYVMGKSVFNIDKNVAGAWSQTKTFKQSVDYGYPFHFMIGPIPVSGKIGVRGSAGVNFMFGVRQAHANMHITPFIDVKAYAQAGVDIGIASAGAGVNLTLLKDTLDLGAEVGLDFDSQKGPYISQHLYLHNKLEMLSGNFYLYAKVNYLIGSHKWTMNIWNWQGYRVDGYLFNITSKTYLNPGSLAQPVAATSR